MVVESVEPRRAVGERRHRRDKGRDLDDAARHHVDALRIFAVRRAGALPAALAACRVTSPIMPTPMTTAASPSLIGVMETAWTPMETASMRAACSKGKLSGRRYMIRRGTETNSAKAPWRLNSFGATPTTWRLSQRFTSPATQNAHLPQYTVESKVTRSPGFRS